MTWREFRFVRTSGKPLVWRIKQDGETYYTQHGQLDGAMQEFSDTPGPKGKEDTKSYVDPVTNCEFNLNREIRKKTESGYIEYDSEGNPLSEQVTSLSFDKQLPKSFTSFKPQTSIKPQALQKLHSKKLARYSRKYDGFATLMVHHTFGWQVYSRRMDLLTEHFPKHVAELSKLSFLKVGTILVGELLCVTKEGKDDFKSTSRVCRSKAPESLDLRASGEVPEPLFVTFDALFHNGQDLQNQTYDERSKIWKINLPTLSTRGSELVLGVEYFDVSPDTWEGFAKEKGWEGFVVTDGSACPGDKFFNFNGKAKRPAGSYKLKPTYSEDCVIYAAFKGTGKRKDGAGSVFVKQLHPETGEWMDLGKCGSGFTDETLAELNGYVEKYSLPLLSKAPEIKNLDVAKLSGPVCEIEYSERQPGTNKFRFPVFKRFRHDKAPEECEAQRLAPEDD